MKSKRDFVQNDTEIVSKALATQKSEYDLVIYNRVAKCGENTFFRNIALISGSTTTKIVLDVLSKPLKFNLLDSPLGRPENQIYGNITYTGHHIPEKDFLQLIGRFLQKRTRAC